jgi:hypothetical protein
VIARGFFRILKLLFGDAHSDQRFQWTNHVMADPIRFRVRPGYHSENLLVEFCADNRAADFPDVAELLRQALRSQRKKHPSFDEANIAMTLDRFIGFWSYPGGTYEIDDDIWGLFVRAEENNRQVIAEVERALLATGQFVKEDVDFADYA